MIRSDKDVRLFDCLPDRMLLLIFSFINVAEDYARLAQVDKRFHRVVNTSSLWARKELNIKCLEKYTDEEIKVSTFSITQILTNFLFSYPATLGISILASPKRTPLIHHYMTRENASTTPKGLGFSEGLDLFDFNKTSNFKPEDLDRIVEALFSIHQAIVTKDPSALSKLHEINTDLNCTSKYLIWKYRCYAQFILYHLHLRNKLNLHHLTKLAEIAPEVAKSVISDPLPVFDNALDEHFFRILAASFSFDDYNYWKHYPFVIRYLRQEFAKGRIQIGTQENEVVLTKTLENKTEQTSSTKASFSLLALLVLAYRDSRIALLVIETPQLGEALGIEAIFDLGLYWLNNTTKVWLYQYLQRWQSHHRLLKESPNSPFVSYKFDKPLARILWNSHLAPLARQYFQCVSFARMHIKPPYFPSYTQALVEVRFVTVKEESFILYMSNKEYQSYTAKWDKECSKLYNSTPKKSAPAPNSLANTIGNEYDSEEERDLTFTLKDHPSFVFRTEPPILTVPMNTPARTVNVFRIIAWVLTLLVMLVGLGFLLASISPDYASLQTTFEIIGGVCLGLGGVFGFSLLMTSSSNSAVNTCTLNPALHAISSVSQLNNENKQDLTKEQPYQSLLLSSHTDCSVPEAFSQNDRLEEVSLSDFKYND